MLTLPKSAKMTRMMPKKCNFFFIKLCFFQKSDKE